MTSFHRHWLGAILLLLASCPLCYAQRRYVPPGGSPIPRQLDYFRADVGVLDPYNTFVAPRRRLDQNLQRLAAQQQSDEQATRQALSMIRQAAVAPTGTGATFMNYSHYYSRSGGTGISGSARTAPARSTPIRPSSSYASDATSAYGAGNFSADSYKPGTIRPGDYGTGSVGARSYGTRSFGNGVYGR